MVSGIMEKLKAQAYDLIAMIEHHSLQIEAIKKSLAQINDQIRAEASKEKDQPKTDSKTD